MLPVHRVLQREEVAAIAAYLNGRPRDRARYLRKRSPSRWASVAVFRLACGCGLRSKEIIGLKMRDVQVGGQNPYVRVRAATTKHHRNKNGELRAKDRWVPLYWDTGTLQDITEYVQFRTNQGAGPDDLFLVCQRPGFRGRPYRRNKLAAKWKSAIRVLGKPRVAQLSIHCGRHTFCTASFASGRSLDSIRDAMGHSNLSTTSQYAHGWEQRGLPDIFARA